MIRRCVLVAICSVALTGFGSSLSHGKKVVLVDNAGEPNSTQEGYERARGLNIPPDVLQLDGNMTAGLANVQNGDELIIICHGHAHEDDVTHQIDDTGFQWGGQTYWGFGNGNPDLMPVPQGFGNLRGVKIRFGACWSARVPPGDASMLQDLIDAMGGPLHGHNGLGYVGVLRDTTKCVLSPRAPADSTKAKEAKRALDNDQSWLNARPANSGAIDNQQTAAQAIVDQAV